jgi:hypothetical protein
MVETQILYPINHSIINLYFLTVTCESNLDSSHHLATQMLCSTDHLMNQSLYLNTQSTRFDALTLNE